MHDTETVSALVGKRFLEQLLVVLLLHWIDRGRELTRRFAVRRFAAAELKLATRLHEDARLRARSQSFGQRRAHAAGIAKHEPGTAGRRLRVAVRGLDLGCLPGDAVEPAAGVDRRVAAAGPAEPLHLDSLHQHEYIALGVDQMDVGRDPLGAWARIARRAQRIRVERLREIVDRLDDLHAADRHRHVRERAERAVVLNGHRT